MNILKVAKDSVAKIKLGFIRFPVPLLLSVSAAYVLMTLNHLPQDALEFVGVNWQRALLGIIMAIPTTLSIHIVLERLQKPPTYKPLGAVVYVPCFVIAGFAFAAYTWFFIPDIDDVTVIRAIMLTVVSVIIFICISHWWRRGGLASHATRLLVRLLVTILYSGILMLSLFAILYTLNSLLNLAITDKHYTDTAILVWSLFAPFYLFAGIPKARELSKPSDSPEILRFLMHRILIPLLAVYTAILYVYSAKILIEQVWPKGIVSSLILAYLCIGILVWFLSSPTKDANKFAYYYHVAYPFATLPLFAVLSYAIGIRISEYGITEERWFVIILASWCALAISMLAVRTVLGEAKADKLGLRVILLPVSLALITASSVVGPMSAFEVSIRSQRGELIELLENYDMLQNGVIKPAEGEVSLEDRQRLSNILYWFDGNHGLDKIQLLPDGSTMAEAETLLGFPIEGLSPTNLIRYVRFQLDANGASVAISGYDYLFAVPNFIGQFEDAGSGLTLRTTGREGRIELIELLSAGEVVYSKDLNTIIKGLIEKHSSNLEDSAFMLDQTEMTFDDADNAMRFRLILRSIEGSTKDMDNMLPSSVYAEAQLLVDKLDN